MVAFPISSSVVIFLILHILNNSFETTLGAQPPVFNPTLGASKPTLGASVTTTSTTATTATTSTTTAAATPSAQTTVQPIINGGLAATAGNPSVLPANQLTPGASVSVNCIKGLKYNDVDLYSCIEDNHPAQTTIKVGKDTAPAKVATTAAKPKTTTKTAPAKTKSAPAKATTKKTTTAKPAAKKIPAKVVPTKTKK